MNRAIVLGAVLAVLGACRKERLPCDEPNGPHDHAPRHGGLVGMIAQDHLELVDTGREIHLYHSDRCRRPLQVAGAGRLTLEPGAGAAVDGVLRSSADGSRWIAARPAAEFSSATVAIRLYGVEAEMTFPLVQPDAGAGPVPP